ISNKIGSEKVGSEKKSTLLDTLTHKKIVLNFKEVAKEQAGDIVFSPFSAETVLAMTAEGAKGDTLQELVTGASLPQDTQTRQAAFGALIPSLTKPSNGTQLLIADRIYVEQGADFRRTACGVYRAGVQNVNFADTQQTSKLINDWVEKRTNDKIQNLISPQDISAATAMVLVNTLYLNASWATPFPKERTSKAPFHTTPNKTEQIDTMHSVHSYKYFHCGYTKAKYIEIPYKGSNLSMTFALPDAVDGLENMEKKADVVFGDRNYRNTLVSVSIPKFSISTSIDFTRVLKKLGVETPFSSSANFSGISNKTDLHISKVQQKAFINVTESGTEAAAATSVVISKASVEPSQTFNANHPFMYYIKDDESGVILFAGRFTYLRLEIEEKL
ncbi:hypothetical protein NQ318_003389, partial [Aromia moschata]